MWTVPWAAADMHTRYLKRLGAKGRLIGIDQDADAIAGSVWNGFSPFGDKVTIVRSNYRNIKEVLSSLGIEKVDGIYLDLGVSSYQLDTAERGFTYREDAPLDMRMDQRNEKTAADIVNEYSEMELYRIIRDYGEDRFAKNIAKHIVRARQENHAIETTDAAGGDHPRPPSRPRYGPRAAIRQSAPSRPSALS